MRRNDTRNIKDIVSDYLKEYNLEDKLRKSQVIKIWPQLMGPAIGNATDKIYFKGDILFIHMNSSIVRNEIFMMREQVKLILNKKVGKPLIREVVVK
jgi:hypothetical protein